MARWTKEVLHEDTTRFAAVLRELVRASDGALNVVHHCDGQKLQTMADFSDELHLLARTGMVGWTNESGRRYRYSRAQYWLEWDGEGVLFSIEDEGNTYRLTLEHREGEAALDLSVKGWELVSSPS